MLKTKDGLTPAELEAMKKHRDKWIANAFQTGDIPKEDVIRNVKELYKVSGLEEPRVIIVPSPLVMAFAGGAASWIWNCRATESATDAATATATYDATRDATDAATATATYAATRDATESATYAATATATYDGGSQTTIDAIKACRDLAGDGGISCADKWFRLYQGGNMWSSYECFLTSFRDVLGLNLPIYEKYKPWEELAKTSGFRFMHEKFCIVTEFPVHLKIDSENRPHADGEPSHLWKDGFCIYSWHGTNMPEKYGSVHSWNWEPEWVLTEKNAELRKCLIEGIGYEKMLRKLNAKELDSFREYKLYRIENADVEPIHLLNMICPSTGSNYCLRVPPDIDKAKKAVDWCNHGIKDFVVET